jgi:hypothetical protein
MRAARKGAGMSLQDLGNIGEFVAAVAVVVSLIYLAVQIRQNTRSVRASTYHSVNRSAREAEMAVGGSETLADILVKGNRKPEGLTPSAGAFLYTSVLLNRICIIGHCRKRSLFFLSSEPKENS